MQGEFNSCPQKFTGGFSAKFEREFSELFRIKYGYNKYYPLNKVYNDFIHDRHHTHLAATRWKSLGAFSNYLIDCC
jgi:DNA/RNA-binding protein KIN17